MGGSSLRASPARNPTTFWSPEARPLDVEFPNGLVHASLAPESCGLLHYDGSDSRWLALSYPNPRTGNPIEAVT